MARPVIAYVGVGSNVGPEENIASALDLLAGEVEVAGVSTFYRTQALGPDGPADAPRFLNGVWAVRTGLTARSLKFDVLRGIEDALGRSRSAERYAPRTIDLDLVLYGAEIVDDEDMRLPSPDLERPFVAWPLLELAPDLVLPDSGEDLARLCRRVGKVGLEPDAEFTRMLRERMKR